MNTQLPAIDFNTAPVLSLSARETKREYLTSPLSLENLGLLLWAGQGLRGDNDKRTAPSAGGMYPLRLFVLAHKVEALEVGLYQYRPDSHSLETAQTVDTNGTAAEFGIGEQPWLNEAAAIVIVTADMALMAEHFKDQPPTGQRGERYAYIETGAVAQNLQLQAGALQLGTVLVGGFHNDKVANVMALPKGMEATALLCIGNV